jgi:hypothetical protein
MRFIAPLLAGLALVLLLPDTAWAFGPATHIFLGQHLLDSLFLLPEAVANLLRAYPKSFLYGSGAADISFAKKYVPAGRHCHFWPVGEELYREADNARLRAVALGYLGHLAADTIAHNYFVPRQLLLTSSTKAIGHSYWEARLDTHLGERYAATAMEVVMDYDHSEADALFDRVLSGTIFSFETNRRIFRGMIRVQDNERWKSVFDRMVRASRWDMPHAAVEEYVARSFDLMIDYLQRRQLSVSAGLDPTGELNLRLAKKLRRIAVRDGALRNRTLLLQMADEFYPLPPAAQLGFWQRAALQNGSPTG